MVAATFEIARRDRHKAIGIRMRQRPQQRRVNDAEHGEVDADAKSKHGNDGWNARVSQPADRVTRVLSQFVEETLPASRPHLFLQGFGAAKLQPRSPPRVLERNAASHQVVGISIDMEPELLGNPILETAPAKGYGERRANGVKQRHLAAPCR